MGAPNRGGLVPLPTPSDPLATLTRAEQLLSEASTVNAVRDIVDMAEVARVLAREAELGTAAVNHAVLVKNKALRRLAEMVEQGQRDGTIATRKAADEPYVRPPDVSTYADLGLSRQRVSEAKAIKAAFTEEELRTMTETATAQDREVSTTAIVRAARNATGSSAGAGDMRPSKTAQFTETLPATRRMVATLPTVLPERQVRDLPFARRKRSLRDLDWCIERLQHLREQVAASLEGAGRE